jgi:hypothetical protein
MYRTGKKKNVFLQQESKTQHFSERVSFARSVELRTCRSSFVWIDDQTLGEKNFKEETERSEKRVKEKHARTRLLGQV